MGDVPIASITERHALAMEQEVKRRWSRKELWLGALGILATIGLCVVAVYYKDEITSTTYLSKFGLAGVMIVSFIAGSTFSITAIPVPYWLLVFTLPSILANRWGVFAPIGVGVTSALGATLGHLPTFMIGYGGGGISQRITTELSNRFSRLYTRAMKWAQRHGSWAVFGMSAVLNPIHLPMTIAMGALHYPPRKFFFFSLLGNGVKSLVIAFCGYFGLTSLFDFLGI